MNYTELAPINITLVLDGRFRLSYDEPSLKQAIVEAVENKANLLIHELGIPAEPKVELAWEEVQDGIRACVNERESLYPQVLFAEARRAAGHQFEAISASYSWRDWLEESPVKRPEAAAFLSQVVLGILQQHPERLLEPTIIRLYLDTAKRIVTRKTDKGLPLYDDVVPATRNGINEWTETDFLAVLRTVFSLGIAIGDVQTVATIFGHFAKPFVAEEVAEALITQLSPAHVELKASSGYFKKIFPIKETLPKSFSTFDPEAGPEAKESFDVMSKVLFEELGLRVPEIRFVSDDRLAQGMFALRVNHLTGFPQWGLAADEVLAYFPAEALQNQFNFQPHAKPAIHPADQRPCAIVNSKEKAELEAHGIWTWSPIKFLVLATAAQLRRQAGSLVHSGMVENDLAQLHKSFPELVLSALHRLSFGQITRLERRLLCEEISIRDLRTLLERLTSYERIKTKVQENIVLDDRWAVDETLDPPKDIVDDYLGYVRLGLNLAYKYFPGLIRGLKTLPVFRLHESLEKRLFEHLAAERGNTTKAILAKDELSRLHSAVREKLRRQGYGAPPVPLLTKSLIRGCFRELLGDEFPQLVVLGYEELPTDCRIQSLGQISLEPTLRT